MEYDIWLRAYDAERILERFYQFEKVGRDLNEAARTHLRYFLKCFILEYSSRGERRRCRVIFCAPCYLAIEFPVDVLRRVAPYLDNESEERAVPWHSA